MTMETEMKEMKNFKCIKNQELKVLNTYFKKEREKLITYKLVTQKHTVEENGKSV